MNKEFVMVPRMDIADALEACDWSGTPIGNKAIILSAVQALRAEQHHADPSEVERLREGRTLLLEDLDRRDTTVAELRAALSYRDSLLRDVIEYYDDSFDCDCPTEAALLNKVRESLEKRPK